MSGADRQRRFRQREHRGTIMLRPIEIDKDNLVWLLVTAEKLDPTKANDREAIARALEDYLAEISSA